MFNFLVLQCFLEYSSKFGAWVSYDLGVVRDTSVVFVVNLINQVSVAGFVAVCDLLFEFLHLAVDLDFLELNTLLLAEFVF